MFVVIERYFDSGRVTADIVEVDSDRTINAGPIRSAVCNIYQTIMATLKEAEDWAKQIENA